MKHLIFCSEYPPVPNPPGGIGTYVCHIAQLLAESGETVHVISQLWKGAPMKVESKCQGRLIIHRVPFLEWKSPLYGDVISKTKSQELEGLFQSPFSPQCFSWQASLLAERLVEQEGIDIIESQEFQAPLYYFQLRRALGLGPKRNPPCLIHLHSPTEFIALHNKWDIDYPFFQTAKRLEDYSIVSADALLCPSQYFARQAEVRYGLETNNIQVIPLPIGDNPLLEREKDIWQSGTICYVGRLEERKGVIEWLDAAIAVAREYPMAQFEFVGANCLASESMSGEEIVERRIPSDLRVRFNFRGKQDRSALPQFLQQARIAAVPSRWENFPNTCVEAMCSGLPVIASREGGMVEMIEDGQTGWLVNQPGIEGLAEALKRALNTPPAQLAGMGHAAALSIRRMCNNQKTIEAQIAFRQEIVNRGATRSPNLPVNLPWIKNPLVTQSGSRTRSDLPGQGIAVIVTCYDAEHLLEKCLQSLRQQTQQPATVIIMTRDITSQRALKVLEQARLAGWLVIQQAEDNLIQAKNTAIEKILCSGFNPVGFAFLDVGDHLKAEFISSCEAVLRHCPDVGIISCWVRYFGARDKFWFKPCPSFPYQWVSNEVAPFSVVRTEALRQAGNFRLEVNQGYEDWDLANAVMAQGWIPVTFPSILGKSRCLQKHSISTISSIHTYVVGRRKMIERFPDLMLRDSKDVALLFESERAWFSSRTSIVQEQFFRASILLHYSQGVYWYILKKFKNEMVHVLGKAKYKAFLLLKGIKKRTS